MNQDLDNAYMWYACYGSNLAQARFLCYLQGGHYPGNRKAYQGARNTAAPTHSEKHQLNHPLYFAKEAHIWGGGGVCFISNHSQPKSRTLARLYRITQEQFADLHAQECNRDKAATLDFKQAQEQGHYDAFAEKWYGRILYLGMHRGESIFTFTHVGDLTERKAPAPNYLKSLMEGLRQSHGLTPQEIAQYLLAQEGVSPAYSIVRLLELARS